MLTPERIKFNLFLVFFVVFVKSSVSSKCPTENKEQCPKEYEPTWESLDSRPLPQWYDNAKVGIFVHWGVYTVPSFGTEWFWINWKTGKQSYVDFMKKNYAQGFTYQEFAHEFRGELFNATQWAKLFKDSGAQYVVLTSKHHDGFCLWPSSRSYSWNSVDLGPKKDIVEHLSTAVRKEGLIFGLYYSLFEWFNPMYIEDKGYLFLKDYYVRNKVIPELTELVTRYKPLVLWSDGDWEAPENYWNSKNFLTWLYNDSPVKNKVVTNDRWGSGVTCHHGDFYTCTDRFNPGVLQKHKFENAFTIDRNSWGQENQVTLEDFLTTEEIIAEVAVTVACGGNVLINVGPTKYGTIQPIFEERLRDMGYWLKINGEAIYSTKPWYFQNDTNSDVNVWYTCKGSHVYAIVLEYPFDTNYVDLLAFQNREGPKDVELLGMENYLVTYKWQSSSGALRLKFPSKLKIDKHGLKFAWTFKLTFDS